MPAKNKVTAVVRDPDQDGDNIVEVTCEDGKVIDVAIDLAAAQVLVEILQRRLVVWAHESVKNLSLPQVDVTNVDIAHSGPASQLMVTTKQIGAMILLMSDESLRKIQAEAGRALTYRAGPQTH